VNAFIAAGAGFLLAVLWFDLMFDVQVLGRSGGEPSEEALASIGGYYARVTTAARPMDRLVAIVMLATLVAIVLELVDGGAPTWVAVASLVLAGAAIVLTGTRTLPSAVRLGSRRDPLERQGELAREILHQHLFSAGAIALVLVLQLGCA